ncbi:hypothetical protein [Streptomyces sp. NBC_00233]|uniref:hypothetical protein n=1 Tax=Streptomyces sp. NBC_00233 TaxID=2975686 RepID=UPI00224CE4B7|nr:hypothetical protein [Streptomyces sp. NBC_00233]MCX5233033.1 hypothetical protein [Streptomyces sp. NBC_00233]
MTNRAEADQLHRLLDGFANSIPHAPVNVDNIIRAAHRRRARRRTAGILAGASLLLGPLTFLAIPHDGPPPAADAPRVVPSSQTLEPGEKVVIAAGVKLWLTKDGKVCFQSLKSHPICNDAAGRKPGAVLVLLDEDEGHRAIIGGIFTGQGTPARMKAHTLNGAHDGTVVTLAGTPGWGAWYADAGITKGSPVNDMPPQSFLRSVAVYDTAGKTIAKLRASASR